MTDPARDDTGRQGRLAAVAIAIGGILAIFAPAIVHGLGLPFRFEFLIYLISVALFIWALVVTLRIWHKSRK